MPIFELQAPDGEIYEVDAPDEVSAVQAFKGFHAGSNSEPESQQALDLRAQLSAMTQNPDTGNAARAEYDALPEWKKAVVAASDIGQLAASGAGMGFIEKAAAAVRAPFTDKNYTEELANQRALTEAARARAGSAGKVAEIGGAIATPVAAARNGATLAGRFGTGAVEGVGGLTARTALMTAEGAGYGAGTAVGNDTDISEGAILGAVGGAAGNVLGEGVQGGLNLFRGAPARAGDYVSKAAQMDALTPEAAAARIQELGPGATLADLGPNMRGQAAALATTPGGAQQTIRSAIGERAAGAGGRIKEAVDSGLGQPTNTASLAEDIINMRSRTSRPLYDAAYAKPLPVSDEIVALMERPAVARAFTDAQRLAANAGETFDAAKPNVQALDYTKRALDDMISTAQRSGNNNEARILAQARSQLVDYVDDAVPEYAAARKSFAGASTVLEALEDGGQVFKNSVSPDQLTKYMASLDDAGREAFTQGARQQVADIMGTARNDAQAAKALFAKGYNREKLAIVLGEDGANKLLNSIDAEEAFTSTRNAVTGGSDTATKARAGGLVAGSPADAGVLRNAANMRLGDAGMGLIDSIFGGITAGRNANTNEEIARILMSADTTKLASTPQSTALSDDLIQAIMGAGAHQAGQGEPRAAATGLSTEDIAGMIDPGNIDLGKRPVAKNSDGSISTVRSISINEDGKEILIPTISPSGVKLTDEGAIALYHKTGKHLGTFSTPEEANAYAETLHKQQERQYAN